MAPESELDLLLACENSAQNEEESAALEIEGRPVVADQPQPAGTENNPEVSIEPPSPDTAAASLPSNETTPDPPAVFKSMWLTGFARNHSGLNSPQITTVVNLASEIVGQQGNPQPVRCIRIVGGATGSKAGTLATRRVASVRAALQQAMDAMWPRLSQQISFIEEIAPSEQLQSRDANDQAPEQKRGVRIVLETGASKTVRAFPAIVSTAADQFSWQTVRVGPVSMHTAFDETSAGKALRDQSRQGFFYVLSAEAAPGRWICSLEINFEPADHYHSPRENPITLCASGLLISPRHILTAGHCLYSRLHQAPTDGVEAKSTHMNLLRASSICICSAHNAMAQPFPAVTVDDADALRYSARWRVSSGVNTEFDFALITLPEDMPESVRFWGGPNHRIMPLPDDTLRGATIQTAGYPELEPNNAQIVPGLLSGPEYRGTQWATLGIITRVENHQLFHDMPVRSGQNGSPVWLQAGTRRVLVGILGLNQQITRISPRLLKRLRAWMAQDGVRPSF